MFSFYTSADVKEVANKIKTLTSITDFWGSLTKSKEGIKGKGDGVQEGEEVKGETARRDIRSCRSSAALLPPQGYPLAGVRTIEKGQKESRKEGRDGRVTEFGRVDWSLQETLMQNTNTYMSALT